VKDPGNRCSVRLAKKCASIGGVDAPPMVNKVGFDHDIGVWTSTPNIQSTAKAPVMPSSASATGPYALPPTRILVTRPVRIPIASNAQAASIRIGSPYAREMLARSTTLEREPKRARGQKWTPPPRSIHRSVQPPQDRYFLRKEQLGIILEFACARISVLGLFQQNLCTGVRKCCDRGHKHRAKKANKRRELV